MFNKIKKGCREIRDGYRNADDLYQTSQIINKSLENGIPPEECYEEIKNIRDKVESENAQSRLKSLGYSSYFIFDDFTNFNIGKEDQIDMTSFRSLCGIVHEEHKRIEKEIEELAKNHPLFFRLARSE